MIAQKHRLRALNFGGRPNSARCKSVGWFDWYRILIFEVRYTFVITLIFDGWEFQTTPHWLPRFEGASLRVLQPHPRDETYVHSSLVKTDDPIPPPPLARRVLLSGDDRLRVLNVRDG